MQLATPRGTRDFLPEQMVRREYVINTVKSVFERYGYDPLETPAVEFAETLKGKYGEEEKLIWEFEDLGGRRIALKYDMTVPLARVIAANPQLPKPFKRYQLQPAWRYDEPQKGRYREFWQCDVDIIGSDSVAADAEIVAIIVDVMRALQFEEFTVRISNRRLADRMVRWAGVPEDKIIEAFRAIDKMDKIGADGVRVEFAERGVPKAAGEKILEVIATAGSPKEVLERAEKLLAGDEKAKAAINELRDMERYMALMGVPGQFWRLDLSVVRGLDYYTGPVWETNVTKPRIGSLAGGGRFDKLINKLSGGAADFTGTGTTIGIERIIDAMTELGMFDMGKTKTRVYVAAVKAELAESALEIAQKLRQAGINAQTDLMDRKLSKQFEYAGALGIPFVAVVGPKELAEGKLTLRDMRTGNERLLTIEQAVGELRQ